MSKDGSKRILTVGGCPEDLQRTSAALESAGYFVVKANSATLALNILDCNSDFALIVTEAGLPDFPGKELIKRLRIISDYSRVPSIIISERIKMHEIDELLELGASYFLPKPLNIESLLEYARKILGKD